MTSSKYGYLNAKLGAAVRAMMIPEDNARAIASAMHEIQLAAHDLTIEDEVAEGWRKQLMDTVGGGGTFKATAESLTELERNDFARATWELWAWAHREVWESRS